jgi:hypothetical protein
LYSIPAVLFALGGVLLWSRRRSFATLLIALGFAAMLVGEAASIFLGHEIQAAVRAHPDQDPSLALVHNHHIVRLLAYYLPLSGLWAAAVGLVWHASAKIGDARVS